MKNTYTCEPGTEDLMEMLLTTYSARMMLLILKQVGVTPETKFESTSDGFVRENNYRVTMEVLSKINEKGLKYWGEKGLKEEADSILSCLAETVGMDVKIDENQKQICSDCGEEKFLTEFYKNKTKKLGVNNICKECQKSRNWKRSTAKPMNET